MTAQPASTMFEWHVRHLRTKAALRDDPRGLTGSENEAIRCIQELLLAAPHGTGPAGRISRLRASLDGYERLGLVSYAIRDDASGLIIWTPIHRSAVTPAPVQPPALRKT